MSISLHLAPNIMVRRTSGSLNGETCHVVVKLTDHGDMVAVVDSKEQKNRTALLFLKWDLSRFQEKVRELLKGQNPMELSPAALAEVISSLNGCSNHVLTEEWGRERRYFVYHRQDPNRRLEFTFEEVQKLLKAFVENDYDEHCTDGGEVSNYSATYKQQLDYLRENWGEIENPKRWKYIIQQIEGGAFNKIFGDLTLTS